MKSLRSPMVTGALVVVAVLVVGYQVVWPQWRRSHPATRPAAAPAAAPAVASAPKKPATPVRAQAAPSTNAQPLALPEAKIDRAYVQAHLAEWIDSPQRDPFLLASAEPAEPVLAPEEPPSPVPGWKLKAIWRQTGSRLAAINQGVYQEGDEIQGYKVERIENGQVWFRGSNRLESLSFAAPNPGVLVLRTNANSLRTQKSLPSPIKPSLTEKLFLLEPRGKTMFK